MPKWKTPEVIDLAVEREWTDNVLLNLALTWIEENGHKAAFAEYAAKVAEQEQRA